jgi:hypothetical protein
MKQFNSNNYISNEKYREYFYKTYSTDEIKNKLVKHLDADFFELFINVSISKLELMDILNLLEEKKNQLKNPIKNNKNKNLFIVYSFANLSVSLILILLTKILLIDNEYAIVYKAHLRGYNIEEIHFKFFKSIGLIIVSSIIFISLINMHKIINLYPINYIINNKIKKIKEMILKIEDKINSV